MKDIKKSASLKSKVRGKETQFKIDLDYSPEYDSFNIKVKKGEGFMSYTDALQGLPLDVVQNINEMLEEILIKAGSEGETKEYDNDYADIGQFSLPDSEWKKTEQEYIDLGKKIVKTKFNGDLEKAYDSVVRNKREFGGDFQAGVYAKGGSLQAHGIKEGDTFLRTISGNIQKVKDKNGKIVYINLSTGERDSQPPLPFADGGGIGIEEKIDLTDDKRLRLRKPVMPKRKLTQQEWAEKHNPRAYEYMGKRKMATGGALVGNQKRIDMNKNGKIDAEDFKLLRSSMNGAWRNDHKHVNHNEDYEVRYAKPRPSRKGYKGIRKFATGGGMSFDSSMSSFDGLSFGGKNPKTEKYSVYIEYGNDDENEVKDVELDFSSLQQASNVYKQYSKSNIYKGQEIFDIYILKHYKNGDYEKVDDKYSKGGYVEITDPKKDLFDKGYAIYGGDAWEKFEDVKKISLPKGAFIVKVKTKDNDYFAIAEKRKFKEGGGISNFERLSRVVAKNYEGKRVKPQYQKEYGKVYSKSEAKEVGNKVAGKVKANQKMATGGKTNRGGIMVLAKKIRKDGESWKDALKRAGQQQK